jgi:mannan polymerase complexes MNN9 subunit|tara:strand:- start:744 stop:1319 length:576 start_codon:yes stop_codon:yes gene_type:complete
VLWLDVDLANLPVDILDDLIAVDKDIVVPDCQFRFESRSYDLNSYKEMPEYHTWKKKRGDTLKDDHLLVMGYYNSPQGRRSIWKLKESMDRKRKRAREAFEEEVAAGNATAPRPLNATEKLAAKLALRRELVELDAVGGTAILIRGDAHRNGLIFPPFVTDNKMETEGLVAIAKRMGYKAYGMPRVMTRHN